MNLIGQSVFELESGNKTVDGQKDIRHINLIGGLVTESPPNESLDLLEFADITIKNSEYYVKNGILHELIYFRSVTIILIYKN